MTREDAIYGIRREAMARETAARERERATKYLTTYCMAAYRAGVSISEIAREAGLSRERIRDVLTHQ